MKLAEDSLTRTGAGMWARRVGVAAALVAVVVMLTLLARSFISQADAPRRQVAKISILPDTPPPPPPPPKEEPKKEPPRSEAKPTPQEPVKPQPAPPQNEPIKMEGAAGDGPSAFAAGSVTQDYKGGTPGTGASSPAPSAAVDRANERLYASTARQLLRDEIERQLRPDAGQLTATFALWVESDGRIGRCELQRSGDTPRDDRMQEALDSVKRTLRLPPPPAIQQPMRFRLTVRAQG